MGSGGLFPTSACQSSAAEVRALLCHLPISEQQVAILGQESSHGIGSCRITETGDFKISIMLKGPKVLGLRKACHDSPL